MGKPGDPRSRTDGTKKFLKRFYTATAFGKLYDIDYLPDSAKDILSQLVDGRDIKARRKNKKKQEFYGRSRTAVQLSSRKNKIAFCKRYLDIFPRYVSMVATSDTRRAGLYISIKYQKPPFGLDDAEKHTR
jgi:hypothetical protein